MSCVHSSSAHICRNVRKHLHGSIAYMLEPGLSVHGAGPFLNGARQLSSCPACGTSEPGPRSSAAATLKSGLRGQLPSSDTTGLSKAEANATAVAPQLHSSRAVSASVRETAPFFLSGLLPHAFEAYRGDLPHDDASARKEVNFAAVAHVAPQCWQPADSNEPHGEPSPIGSTHSEGNSDLQRLQNRYDLLLRHPQAFGPQIQLLHRRIQEAQQEQSNQLHMRHLKPLQDRLHTAGAGACLLVKPVVYAAFCIYSPQYIHIAAAMRAGAGAHFLDQYLKSHALTKQKRGAGSLRLPRGAVGAERWLAQSSLQNICVYPLEALSPQLRLFQCCAPQRLATWEEILGKGLAC